MTTYTAYSKLTEMITTDENQICACDFDRGIVCAYCTLRTMLIANHDCSFPDDINENFADELNLPFCSIETLKLVNRIYDLILELDRESLTRIALDLSLCPLHLIDYAICFDDDDSECAAIRMIHPDHDD